MITVFLKAIACAIACILFGLTAVKSYHPRESKSLHAQAESIKALHRILKKIRLYEATLVKSCTIGMSDALKHKNRYNHCPYDENRTCRDLADFYINASDVSTETQNYIVTQGPLSSTVNDFWHMVFHTKSPLIVTCCNAYESGHRVCLPYWEREELPEHITCINKEELSRNLQGHALIKRTFQHGEMTVTQLHYEGWPDNGAPEPSLFRELLDHVDALHTDSKSPITVHCSAGIGRSGTFVASHSMRRSVRAQKAAGLKPRVHLPKRIMELREQRRGLISTVAQLQTVYHTVICEL